MSKLNSFLRWVFVIFGIFFLLTDLLPKERKALRTASDREGFDNEEFDDIW